MWTFSIYLCCSKLASSKSQFMGQLCLFVDHFKQFFVSFSSHNFPSVRIFVFRETMNLLLTLQAHHIFAYLKPETNKSKSRQCFTQKNWFKSCKTLFKLLVKVVRVTICLLRADKIFSVLFVFRHTYFVSS